MPSLGHGLHVHSEELGDPAVFGIKLQGFQSREQPSLLLVEHAEEDADSTLAEFINVASIPAPAPRCAGGSAFITPAPLGAENKPIPAPDMKIRTPKSRYLKSVGSTSSPAKAAADTSKPPEAKARAPCRSDSQPDIGPATTNPKVSGSK